MIERNFDIPFVAKLARREKQIQQSYRPVIGVHKWFARRPGALFRSLLLAEFTHGQPLEESYFQGHNLTEKIIGDPFMGGGTPLLEANRIGCHVVGADINPMAYWIVRQELAELELSTFRSTAKQLIAKVEAEIADLYQTECLHCGNPKTPVKYFLWVKEQPCKLCEQTIRLYPNYLIAKNQRHPNYVLICSCCETLNEVSDLALVETTPCSVCQCLLKLEGPARQNRCRCPHCGASSSYPSPETGPPTHHLFAIEYHCDDCGQNRKGRFFKTPDETDRGRLLEAAKRLQGSNQRFVPDEAIPLGDETTRLHRWGYRSYRDLFNDRQRYSLNLLAEHINSVKDESIRHALLTVFSDTLRYQNMVCRYDSYALKIIDVFSVHGFPVQLVQCENSVLGVPKVGSGGFRHFVTKYERAKVYCKNPFETTTTRSKKKIYLSNESIGGHFASSFPESRQSRAIYIQAQTAEKLKLPDASLDAVLTDPPYFANVQYAELMDFCYVWLKRHLAKEIPAFRERSTRREAELTVNQTAGRDICHFTKGLSETFQVFSKALKPGSPFAFTYHHNDLEAYLPVAVALLDAKLVCTVTLPCPAEMDASIHINGTKSSVIDTIFVCRTTGTIKGSQFRSELPVLEQLLHTDLVSLQAGEIIPTLGDARCLLLGHLTRLVVWQLRLEWQPQRDSLIKLSQVRNALQSICYAGKIDHLAKKVLDQTNAPVSTLLEVPVSYNTDDELSF